MNLTLKTVCNIAEVPVGLWILLHHLSQEVQAAACDPRGQQGRCRDSRHALAGWKVAHLYSLSEK